MSLDTFPIPETHVLAIASHVVYGNVGNTMAAQVLRYMGCEVAALNTVHFSNHTGYKQVRGTKSTAEEMKALYEGLRLNGLRDFDVMLSGYIPGAAAVKAVGDIAKDLRQRATKIPGSFFWVLDPVMGDQGKLYVSSDVVPAYQDLLPFADLILPNQFELEVLTDTKISSIADIKSALLRLHRDFDVPHVVVTSLRLSESRRDVSTADLKSYISPTLSVVGSSRTSTGQPRVFRVDVPNIDCYFSGTGDMFAALLVARLREMIEKVPGLSKTSHWLSEDSVPATNLPLCLAVRKVLTSMAKVLELTKRKMDRDLSNDKARNREDKEERAGDAEFRQHLAATKAAEIRLARHASLLLDSAIEFDADEI